MHPEFQHRCSVTVAATAEDGSLDGTLSGTSSVTVSSGLATFDDLSYNRPETIYLTFTSGSMTDDSDNITVSPNVANYFIVTAASASMTAGGSNEITVTAYDQCDNVATGYEGSKELVFTGTDGPETAAADGSYISAHVPTMEAVEFSSNSATVSNVDFTDGVSDSGALTLIAYKVESFTLDVAQSTVNSTGSTDYDVEIAVASHYSLPIT